MCGPIGCIWTAKPEGRHYGYGDVPSAKVGLGATISGSLDLFGALKVSVDSIVISFHNDPEVVIGSPEETGGEAVVATAEFTAGNVNSTALWFGHSEYSCVSRMWYGVSSTPDEATIGPCAVFGGV